MNVPLLNTLPPPSNPPSSLSLSPWSLKHLTSMLPMTPYAWWPIALGQLTILIPIIMIKIWLTLHTTKRHERQGSNYTILMCPVYNGITTALSRDNNTSNNYGNNIINHWYPSLSNRGKVYKWLVQFLAFLRLKKDTIFLKNLKTER